MKYVTVCCGRGHTRGTTWRRFPRQIISITNYSTCYCLDKLFNKLFIVITKQKKEEKQVTVSSKLKIISIIFFFLTNLWKLRKSTNHHDEEALTTKGLFIKIVLYFNRLNSSSGHWPPMKSDEQPQLSAHYPEARLAICPVSSERWSSNSLKSIFKNMQFFFMWSNIFLRT